MKKRIALLAGMFAATFVLGALLVSAQQPDQPQEPKPARPAQPPHPPMDPLGDVMFPPEMVMQHQRELALTDEQKTFMRSEINRATTRFNDLQWQLQDALEALHETMKANSVNEQLALSQLDKVLDGEREIKRAHMELAIRIKNKLTQEQQTKLQSMRRPMGPGPDGPERGRPSGPDGPERGPGRRPGGPDGPPPGAEPRPPAQPPEGLFPPERPLVP
jgi:Spy/CpxP family protein refolding chaperone